MRVLRNIIAWSFHLLLIAAVVVVPVHNILHAAGTDTHANTFEHDDSNHKHHHDDDRDGSDNEDQHAPHASECCGASLTRGKSSSSQHVVAATLLAGWYCPSGSPLIASSPPIQAPFSPSAELPDYSAFSQMRGIVLLV